jgi:hypothetical protein
MVTSFTEKGRKGGQTTPTFALPLPPGYPLFIDVDSDEEAVHVSFPLEAAADTVTQLAR